MNTLIVLTSIFATAAFGAPASDAGHYAVAGPPAVAVAKAPSLLPTTYTTQEVRGAPSVTVHQPPAQVTKQLHFADRSYVAGYSTEILKPAIPDFRIAVPTALKGTTSYTAPIVNVAKEAHVVNEPVPVEKPYSVPYDVVKHVEEVVEVPTPVHVSKPYAVPYPVAVPGEPIVQRVRTAPVVSHQHYSAYATPSVYAAGLPVAAVSYGHK